MARSLNDVLQSCYEQLDSYDIVSTVSIALAVVLVVFESPSLVV